jgi:hypothetical protein
MKDEKYIRIGFFENFKGEDSVLIEADIYGLLEIETVLLNLTDNKKEFNTKDFELLDKEHCLEIQMKSGDNNDGLRRFSNDYKWTLTPEKWDDIREMTTVLIKNSTGGHQYLDSDTSPFDDLQVVLSFDEYGIDFWKKFESEK